MSALIQLQRTIVACELCPRLIAYCREVALVKRRAYRDEEYWGKPVPSFGDPAARLLIVGLAPGAHGANRTGRMFTGDRSGDFLFAAMHATGFANQPDSKHREDGLALQDAYLSAAARCAPPDNRPTPEEFGNCRPYLQREIALLKNVRVVLCLGALALEHYLKAVDRKRLPFAHGAAYAGAPTVLCSYHPSQQNTQTGRLTMTMLVEVFEQARALCG